LVTVADLDEIIERILEVIAELQMLAKSLGFGNKPRG